MLCTSAPRSKWATSSSEWDLVASSPTSEHFYSGFLSILTLAVTIPPTVRVLNLYGLRKLPSLRPLAHCVELEILQIRRCREVRSLEGVEQCRHLQRLVVDEGAKLESLEPLRHL